MRPPDREAVRDGRLRRRQARRPLGFGDAGSGDASFGSGVAIFVAIRRDASGAVWEEGDWSVVSKVAPAASCSACHDGSLASWLGRLAEDEKGMLGA